MFEITTLATPRLQLRKLRLEDAPAYFSLRSSEKVMHYIQRPLAQSEAEVRIQIEEQLQAQAEGKIVVWAIADLNDTLIGIAGYWRMQLEHQRSEVGYLLDAPYHGQGYGTEALHAVLDYGFKVMKLHKIEADVDPENIASLKLLKRFGFQHEALFRENRFYDGKFYDSCWLGILAKEWLSQNGNPS